MIQCKFKCISISVSGENLSVNLQPIKDDAFGKYTPAGQINLQVIPEVANKFAVGSDYLVNFEEVQKQSSGCSNVSSNLKVNQNIGCNYGSASINK